MRGECARCGDERRVRRGDARGFQGRDGELHRPCEEREIFFVQSRRQTRGAFLSVQAKSPSTTSDLLRGRYREVLYVVVVVFLDFCEYYTSDFPVISLVTVGEQIK